jgi:hypothetical protein
MNKYYELFLSNFMKRKKYKISLMDGSVIIGVPRCSSVTVPTNIKFHVTTTNEKGESNTQSYNIDDILKVEEC